MHSLPDHGTRCLKCGCHPHSPYIRVAQGPVCRWCCNKYQIAVDWTKGEPEAQPEPESERVQVIIVGCLCRPGTQAVEFPIPRIAQAGRADAL